MRLFFTILIAAFLLGGTYIYTNFASRTTAEAQPYQVNYSAAKYSLELIRTFTANPRKRNPNDSASSSVAPTLGTESISVRFKGQSLLTRDSAVPQTEKLVVESIPGVEVGANEIFVRAHLEPPKTGELVAMQAKVLVDGRIVSTSTFTGFPGSPWIYGTIVFEGLQPTPRGN